MECQEGRCGVLVFSPDGKTLAAGHRDEVIKLWNVADLSELATLSHGGRMNDLAFSPDGKMLLSVTGPWTTGPATSVCLWDAATHALLARFATHQPGTMAATFSPDGKILATTGRDGRVHLWDVAEVLEKAAVD